MSETDLGFQCFTYKLKEPNCWIDLLIKFYNHDLFLLLIDRISTEWEFCVITSNQIGLKFLSIRRFNNKVIRFIFPYQEL